MSVHEAEAIVLRQYALSDSDCIVVFATREFGKVRAAAYGVKKPKSRFAGCLEPLNHVRIEYYVREGHELGRINDADLIHSYLGKSTSLTQIYAFTYFAELMQEIVQDYQPNDRMFRLFLASLAAGENNAAHEALVRYFEIWCLRLNGFLPNYAYCSNCGKCVKDDGFFAWVESGQARCDACAKGRGLRVGSAAAAALHAMIGLSPEKFASEPMAKAAAKDIERLSQMLMVFHLEKRLKSYPILWEALQQGQQDR